MSTYESIPPAKDQHRFSDSRPVTLHSPPVHELQVTERISRTYTESERNEGERITDLTSPLPLGRRRDVSFRCDITTVSVCYLTRTQGL